MCVCQRQRGEANTISYQLFFGPQLISQLNLTGKMSTFISAYSWKRKENRPLKRKVSRTFQISPEAGREEFFPLGGVMCGRRDFLCAEENQSQLFVPASQQIFYYSSWW